MGWRGLERDGGRFYQDTFYTCMTFSKNKYKKYVSIFKRWFTTKKKRSILFLPFISLQLHFSLWHYGDVTLLPPDCHAHGKKLLLSLSLFFQASGVLCTLFLRFVFSQSMPSIILFWSTLSQIPSCLLKFLGLWVYNYHKTRKFFFLCGFQVPVSSHFLCLSISVS